MEQRYRTHDACGQAGRRRWCWLQEIKSLVPRVICGVDSVVWTMKDDKGMQASAGSFASTGLQQASVHLQFMHFSSSILF